jgi:hypothetical protein
MSPEILQVVKIGLCQDDVRAVRYVGHQQDVNVLPLLDQKQRFVERAQAAVDGAVAKCAREFRSRSVFNEVYLVFSPKMLVSGQVKEFVARPYAAAEAQCGTLQRTAAGGAQAARDQGDLNSRR